MAALTPKQLAFCEQYLVDLNAKAAAVRAGYSEAGAGQIAHKLLKRPHIKKRVAAMIDARSKRVGVTQDAVIAELAKIGFANMADYISFDEKNIFVDLSKMTRDQSAAVAEITVEEYVEGRGEDAREVKRIKFRLHDKKGALVDLGRHLTLFTDKSEVKVTSPVVINIPARGE